MVASLDRKRLDDCPEVPFWEVVASYSDRASENGNRSVRIEWIIPQPSVRKCKLLGDNNLRSDQFFLGKEEASLCTQRRIPQERHAAVRDDDIILTNSCH
jgi:hypothetical protein